METSIWAMGVIIVACFIGAYAALLLKKASAKMSFSFKFLFSRELIISLSLYGFSTVLFVPALKFGELSVLYPLVATTYIWTSLFSVKFLGEKMNIWKWMGVLVVLIGVSFIGFGGR
tara:strand:- start:50 stop:400 length:351 start_codon:yes stop_codon:yes gene_type:complete